MQTKIESKCGSCDTAVSTDNQFCEGCGQPLWQKCGDCGASALLIQPYCNGCGSNLAEALNERLASYEKIFERSQLVAGQGKYQEAIRLAESIAKPPNYRFNDVSERARQLAQQLIEQYAHWQAEIEKAEISVQGFLAAERYPEVVRTLSPIPPGVLPKALAEILANCQQKLSASESSRAQLKQALATKQYDVAVQCLTELIQLEPGVEQYRRLLTDVGRRIALLAEKYRERGNHSKAASLLQSLPDDLLDAHRLALLNDCEEVLYVRKLIVSSTYLNPLILSAIKKLEVATPNDPLVDKLRKKAERTRRDAGRLQSQAWPEWTKPEPGMLGIPIVPTRIPSSFPGLRPDCLTNQGSQFWVAIGLAIQAAQSPMPTGDLLRSEKPKGMLGLLSAKRPKATEFGWGVDVGESSIRAVRIQLSGDSSRPKIDRAAMVKLEHKPGNSKLDPRALEPAIQELLAQMAIGTERVVVNYPGNELVPRFFKLPPGADRKRIDDFVMQEARAHIPTNLELLHIAYHVSEPPPSALLGPSATLMAGRKTDIAARRALLERAGLRVDGMQPEAFALFNAWQAFLTADASALAAEQGDDSQQIALDDGEADMLIDVRDDRTNIVICHPSGIWQRTINWGIFNLGNSISTEMKVTYDQAEQIRRDPAKAKHLQIPLRAMSAAAQVPRRELERSAYAAREAFGSLRLRRVLLIGGGAYQPCLSSWLNGSEF